LKLQGRRKEGDILKISLICEGEFTSEMRSGDMPVIVLCLYEQCKSISNSIVETFGHVFYLTNEKYYDVRHACSGVSPDGTLRCLGGGYEDTSGPSTPFVLPIDVVTAAQAGRAVANVLDDARKARRPGMPIRWDARTADETVLETIARIDLSR